MKDKHEFVATTGKWRLFTELLDGPERVKPELARLFSERRKQNFATENIKVTK